MCPDPRNEFLHREGLRDVVVRADFQSDNPVNFAGSSAYQDDRASEGLPKESACLKAVHPAGKKNIQQDQVRRNRAGSGERLAPVDGRPNLEPDSP